MNLCGSTPSAVLVVGLLQPPQHFRVHVRTCGEFNLDGHGVVHARRPQTSTRLPPFEPEPYIDAVFCGRLDPGERPARRNEGDVCLARLDCDLAETRGCVDQRVEDGPELRSIRVLTVDELVRRREEKVRVAESLHDQERLRVADHALLREPSAKLLLAGELFRHDAPVPLGDPLARAFLEETSRHLLHPLPITRLRHRHVHPCGYADCRIRRKRFPKTRKGAQDSDCRQDPFVLGLFSRHVTTRGGWLRVSLLDLGEKGFGETDEAVFAYLYRVACPELEHGLVRRELDPRAGRVRPPWESVNL